MKMRIACLLILLLTLGYAGDDLNHLEGRWMVDGSFNYTTLVSDDEYDEISYQAQLTVGPTYFLKDYLGLTLSGLVSTRRGDIKQENYGLTPSVMFVVPLSYGSSKKMIYPHVSAGFSFSETYMHRVKYFTAEGVRLQAGIFIFLNKNVAVHPYYSYWESTNKFLAFRLYPDESKNWYNTAGISLAIFI